MLLSSYFAIDEVKRAPRRQEFQRLASDAFAERFRRRDASGS